MEHTEQKRSPGSPLNFPFHPLLFSIYPILFVYSRNLINIPISDTYRFLGLSAAFFLFLYLGFQIILKDWDKAGMLSSLLASQFYSFGHVYNALETWLHPKDIPFSSSILAWFWVILFLAVSYSITQLDSPQKTTRLLNLVSSLLIVFILVSIWTTADIKSDLTPQEEKTLAELRGQQEAEADKPELSQTALPDIYYVIVDGYVRSDHLEKYYHYDNSNFLDDLKQRGFYILSKSRSNYLNTNYSINSSLNLMYFHQYPRDIFNKTKYNLYTNYVHDFLDEYGYQTVVFDSGTGDTNDQERDIFVSPDTTGTSEKGLLNSFEQFFLRTTMGLLLFRDPSSPGYDPGSDNVVRTIVNRQLDVRRERIRHALNHLPDYASQDSYYFLFSHIYLPHIPFLYGPDGEELRYRENQNLYWYQIEPQNYNEYYAYQIDYLNQAILETIDEILENSSRPVVIILQSDHGDGKYLDRDKPTTKGVEVRSAILNAIYYSDGEYGDLYPSMTPVNTFRVTFNHWFGTQYPIIHDTVYFHEHPLSTGITEKPTFLDSCEHFDVCLPSPPK